MRWDSCVRMECVKERESDATLADKKDTTRYIKRRTEAMVKETGTTV